MASSLSLDATVAVCSKSSRLPRCPTGAAPGVYSGVLDCFVKTFKADGPLAFYNGALADQRFTGDAPCLRLASVWNVPAGLQTNASGPCCARLHAHARTPPPRPLNTAAELPTPNCLQASAPTLPASAGALGGAPCVPGQGAAMWAWAGGHYVGLGGAACGPGQGDAKLPCPLRCVCAFQSNTQCLCCC